MRKILPPSAAVLLLGPWLFAAPALAQYAPCPPGFRLYSNGNCVGWPVPEYPTTLAPELIQPPPAYVYAPPIAQPPPVLDGFAVGAAIAAIVGVVADQHHGEQHRAAPRARRRGQPERR